MKNELLLVAAAIGVALAREARWLLEQRQRRRGELRTRDEDHP